MLGLSNGDISQLLAEAKKRDEPVSEGIGGIAPEDLVLNIPGMDPVQPVEPYLPPPTIEEIAGGKMFGGYTLDNTFSDQSSKTNVLPTNIAEDKKKNPIGELVKARMAAKQGTTEKRTPRADAPKLDTPEVKLPKEEPTPDVPTSEDDVDLGMSRLEKWRADRPVRKLNRTIRKKGRELRRAKRKEERNTPEAKARRKKIWREILKGVAASLASTADAMDGVYGGAAGRTYAQLNEAQQKGEMARMGTKPTEQTRGLALRNNPWLANQSWFQDASAADIERMGLTQPIRTPEQLMSARAGFRKERDPESLELNIPGWKRDPNVTPSLKEVTDGRTMAGELEAFEQNIEKMKGLIDKEGAYIYGGVGSGKDAAQAEGLSKSLQMNLKNLYELGAITGPDMEILQKMVYDPTSWKGMFTRDEKASEKYDTLLDTLQTNVNNQMSKRGYTREGQEGKQKTRTNGERRELLRWLSENENDPRYDQVLAKAKQKGLL